MTALHAISSALLSIHDDPPSPPSDDFQFESEYVKSLLKQRTPSPVIIKPSATSMSQEAGKENLGRWRTPVTIGPYSGRAVLAQRDINSGHNRSASVLGVAGEQTSAVKLASSQPAPSTLGHSTTRYPRRGRLTKLGPPKRTSRLSSDSLETPSEMEALPEAPSVSTLSAIPSSGTEEIKGLRGLIQHQHAILNAGGQYTPPASQSPPVSKYPRTASPVQYIREPTPPDFRGREATPPIQQDVTPRGTPNESSSRGVSSSSSTLSGSTRVSSASRSLGRSSLRHLRASTSQPPIDVAIEGVQKGLEALTMRKEDYQTHSTKGQPQSNSTQTAPSSIRDHVPAKPPSPVISKQPSPILQRQILDRKSPIERDITKEYIPPPGVAINILPTRRKSSSPAPQANPRPSSVQIPPAQPRVAFNDLPNPVPPPKMRGLEPSSPKSPNKKGKMGVMVNSRPYTRLSTIGRGGSSKVYKVISPQSYKIYALKKVSFDKADQSAISGYKNEIRLLTRMAERESQNGGESRCIELYDWEICDEKGYLLMLMECGEIDFAHILAKHSGVPLGLNFIRVYWEQMLRAVHAIHEEKIVHSDLKPANFLLVQGQLKLIDFGIAKRMSDDTTNIHRDQQVGTVNYMSPEAILDTNHNNPYLPPGTGRLMKLGKKSDVWSLGCILYQMIYGKTPFSDLTMYQKIQSIPDENHPIKFPATGTGGVKVDRGAERCVRMCLIRDQRKRWGIEELLTDKFLSGEGEEERLVGISIEEIGSLIEQTLGFGQMNGGKMLSKETIQTLAKDAFEKLRGARLRE